MRMERAHRLDADFLRPGGADELEPSARAVIGKRTELERALAGREPSRPATTPGRSTLLHDPSPARPGFEDCRVLGLRELLRWLGPDHPLHAEALAAADPAVARRAASRARLAPRAPTPGGRAMWAAAERHAMTLYRRAADAGEVDEDDPTVAAALEQRGRGQPLPAALRREMEAELGAPLDRVRVHTDSIAAQAALALRAEAFTVGEDIFFAEHAFAPDTAAGRKLLAHELAHVGQALRGRAAPAHGLQVSSPGDALEREAEAFATRFDETSRRPRASRETPAEGIDPLGARALEVRLRARMSQRSVAGPASAGPTGAALIQRQERGRDLASPPVGQLPTQEVAELLAALARYDADVDLPRARAALEQFRGMDDRDTAEVLELLRQQGLLQAVLDEQLTSGERAETLGRVDTSLGVHLLILDGVPDRVVEAQLRWAEGSFAEDGIGLEVLSRAHADPATTARLLGISGGADAANVNDTRDDGEPADPGAEATAILRHAHGASAARRRGQGPEAHAVFVPHLARGRGVAVRTGWYDTEFPGVLVEAEAGTSTLAHELGHLCGLDHHPNDDGTLTEGFRDPPDASSRTMYPEETNRGSEWSPEEVETIRRSVYARLIPRSVRRREGPARDEPPPPGPGRALGDPVQPKLAGGAQLAVEGEDGRAIAAAGVGGATEALPHAAAIQRSFGTHDLGDVRACIGGPAARAAGTLGAAAYASGDRIAFAEAPDLHTAAHEAAHVVQQRVGVSLAGGYGRAGDAYERHADAVADRVVQGQSAQALLDDVPGGNAGPSMAVQRQERALRQEEVRRLERLARSPSSFVESWRGMAPEARSVVLREMSRLYGREFADAFEGYADAGQLRRGFHRFRRRPPGSPYPALSGVGTMPHPADAGVALRERHGDGVTHLEEVYVHPSGLDITIAGPPPPGAGPARAVSSPPPAPSSPPSLEQDAQALRRVLDEAHRLADADEEQRAIEVLERGGPIVERLTAARQARGGAAAEVPLPEEAEWHLLYDDLTGAGPELPDDEVLDDAFESGEL